MDNGFLTDTQDEKALLLSLSEQLGLIENKDELLQLLVHKLRIAFAVDRFGIDLIDPVKKTHGPYFINCVHDLETDRLYQQLSSRHFILNDGMFDKVMDADGPVNFVIEDVVRQDVLAEYVYLWHKIGITQITGVPLRKGDETIGVVWICSARTIANKILMFFARHIALALSDSCVIENISSREREKALLLDFSNDLAMANGQEELSLVVKKYLRDLLGINEFLITIRNEDAQSYAYFCHILPVSDPVDDGFKTIVGPAMPITGTMTGIVVGTGSSVIFDINEVSKDERIFFPSRSFWASVGASKIQGMPLKVAGDIVGILWVQPGQIHDSLLNGISAQIAIALSNVMANKEIQNRIAEINRYKLTLEEENHYLHEEILNTYNGGEVIGSSDPIKKVLYLVEQVATTNSSVLILGETGTGKELIARAVHLGSNRKNKLMVKVNCAAMPPTLIESELFGHEKGSFTGAFDRRIGKFELAHNGTIFLDEIGEMPLELQVKLLRVLQEREIERIGGKTLIKIDVRIIAATNRDLQKEVDAGRFRSDLYYRLNVFPLTLPPLRERKEDISMLATKFIDKYSKATGKNIHMIANKVLDELIAYDWPGNIRELEHVIERSVIMTSGNTIKEVYLPSIRVGEVASLKIKTLEENERDHIIQTLELCRGKVFGPNGAAEILHVAPSTLNSKIKKLKINK